MIPRETVLRLLGDALWADGMTEDEDYRNFAWAMQLAPSGVTLDPSFSVAFNETAPLDFSSASEALIFCARFLEAELVDFWRYPEGRLIVADLQNLAEGDKRNEVPEPLRTLAERLEKLTLGG